MDYANGALLPTKEPFVIESPNDEYLFFLLFEQLGTHV